MLGGMYEPDESRAGSPLPPILAAALALAFAGASPPTIASDFDAAVARLRGRAGTPGGAIYVARIGLDDFLPEAEALAKSHGPAAAGFFRSRLDGRHPEATHLAFLTLAVLAREPDVAAELTAVLRDSGFRDTGGLLALTYAPAPVALAIADEALSRHDTQPDALGLASVLFRFFGDVRSVTALETGLARRSGRASKGRAEAAANLVALRQRLLRPAAERPSWASQDLIVWRAIRSLPGSRSLDMDLRRQARAACARTRFTPGYLKDRLRASSIDHLELRLILLIAGLQREAALVPELAGFVRARRGPWAGDAMDALLAIGTRDALAPVERLISPPRALPDRGPTGDMSPERLEAVLRGSLVTTVCEALARHGDRETLDLMKSLATDAAYPPQERSVFARTRDALGARLGGGW